MPFDELEWVRNTIDAWLCRHVYDCLVVVAAIVALSSWLAQN